MRLCGAIEAALGEVAAADKRAHLAGGRVHREQRRLQRRVIIGLIALALGAALLDVGKRARRDVVGGLLHGEIDRRVDLQPALVDARQAEPRDQLAAHFFLEPRAARVVPREAVVEQHAFLPRTRRVILRDRAGIDHRLQDDRAARDGARHVGRGRIGRWRLHEPGDERRLAQCHLRRVLAEEAARGRLDAVQPVAEVHLVQVQLEDLILRVLGLELGGDDDLLQFAADRLVACEETLARELLGDGAGALRPPSFAQVRERRAGNPDQVHAAVLVEALILDGHDGLHQERRDLGERHLEALLLEDREGRPPVGREQRRRLRHVADPGQLALARGRVESESTLNHVRPMTRRSSETSATRPRPREPRALPLARRAPIRRSGWLRARGNVA